MQTISCRMRRAQVARLDEIAATCGVTRYRIVEALVLRFLEQYDRDPYFNGDMRLMFR